MKAVAAIMGVVLFLALWLVGIASGLAVPALAVWTPGHFAFHAW